MPRSFPDFACRMNDPKQSSSPGRFVLGTSLGGGRLKLRGACLAWDLIQRVHPGFGGKREALPSPRQPPEGWEMQMHPGDQNAVCADAIEDPFARSGGHGEVG